MKLPNHFPEPSPRGLLKRSATEWPLKVEIEFGKKVRSAIKVDDVVGVTALLDAHLDLLDVVTPFGTWLHVAARAGSLGVTKKLVEMGADLNKRGGTFDAGPLNLAASYRAHRSC